MKKRRQIPHDWREIGNALRRKFRCHRTPIILFLLLVAVLLAIYPRIAAALSRALDGPESSDELAAIIGAVRDGIYSLAVIVAGLWTYYVFVRGRTLKPRMSMGVSLVAVAGADNRIAVIRIEAKNDGNVRVRPKALEVSFSVCMHGPEQVEFQQFEFIENALDQYYSPDDHFHLEPGDAMTLDLATYVGGPMPIIAKSGLIPSLILVKTLLVDSRLKAWKELRVLEVAANRTIL